MKTISYMVASKQQSINDNDHSLLFETIQEARGFINYLEQDHPTADASSFDI